MRNLNKPGIWLGTIAVALAMGGTATAASMITSAAASPKRSALIGITRSAR
jgi:hypothetical protein